MHVAPLVWSSARRAEGRRMRWRMRWRRGKKVGGYFRSRRRTDLFVALPRTSGTVRAWHKPSTEESLYYVNTTGVSPVSIGLVQGLMATAIGRRHGWRQRIADAESARPCTGIGVCTTSTDPVRINTKRILFSRNWRPQLSCTRSMRRRTNKCM